MSYEAQSVLLSEVVIEIYIVFAVHSFCFPILPHTPKVKTRLEEELTN
jgi:hypothetical protein